MDHDVGALGLRETAWLELVKFSEKGPNGVRAPNMEKDHQNAIITTM